MSGAAGGVPLARLEALYAGGDDPWNFRESAYEQAKFRATAAALPRARYRAILEIGCGNGELARHLAPRASLYTGVDAVATALAAARRAVPGGRFARIHLPAALPPGPHELIVLSEVLYFLSPEAIAALARQLRRRWPAADLVAVTWLGETGNPLGGEAALERFVVAHRGRFETVARTPSYRIDIARGEAR